MSGDVYETLPALIYTIKSIRNLVARGGWIRTYPVCNGKAGFYLIVALFQFRQSNQSVSDRAKFGGNEIISGREHAPLGVLTLLNSNQCTTPNPSCVYAPSPPRRRNPVDPKWEPQTTGHRSPSLPGHLCYPPEPEGRPTDLAENDYRPLRHAGRKPAPLSATRCGQVTAGHSGHCGRAVRSSRRSNMHPLSSPSALRLSGPNPGRGGGRGLGLVSAHAPMPSRRQPKQLNE